MHIPFTRSIQTVIAEKKRLKEQAFCGWSFSQDRWNLINAELHEWEKMYFPIDLEGKVVIDVGAGQGETAKLFLEHGAKTVYCIEPNETHYQYLKHNAKNHKGIIPLKAYFDITQLQLSHDFLKVDIEGWEQQLLDIKLMKPTVLEVHGMQLIEAFKKAGYRMHLMPKTPWICYAYWKC